MSLSKINKSVVTIRKGHFMNSVFVNSGIYSCAVHAFLGISTHLFLPYLLNLRLGMSLQTSFSMFVHITCLREKTVHSDDWAKFASLFGRTSLTFVVHSRLGIVMPVLARHLRKEHLVILMKRKKAFS